MTSFPSCSNLTNASEQMHKRREGKSAPEGGQDEAEELEGEVLALVGVCEEVALHPAPQGAHLCSAGHAPLFWTTLHLDADTSTCDLDV